MSGTHGRILGNVLEYYDATSHERVRRFAPVEFCDDFLGSYTVIPAAGSPESGMPWVKKTVQTAGTPSVAGVANAASGVVAAALDATAEKQEATLYMNDQRQFSLEQALVWEARVKLSVLPTLVAEAVWGLLGDWADGPDAATYSAFFTADGSGEVFCEVDDNATDQSATSGITVLATEWHVYRIEFLSLTDVRFYIDGNQVAAATAFAYAATGANAILQPYFACYKASGAGLGTLQADYCRAWQNRS